MFGDQNFSTHSNIYWLALIEKRYWRMCHVTNSLTPLRKRRGYRRLSKYWAQVLGMHRLSFLLNWFLALHPVCNERPWKKIYIIQSLTDFRHFAHWESPSFLKILEISFHFSILNKCKFARIYNFLKNMCLRGYLNGLKFLTIPFIGFPLEKAFWSLNKWTPQPHYVNSMSSF